MALSKISRVKKVGVQGILKSSARPCRPNTQAHHHSQQDYISTVFPKKEARLLRVKKWTFSIILPNLSQCITEEYVLILKNRRLSWETL